MPSDYFLPKTTLCGFPIFWGVVVVVIVYMIVGFTYAIRAYHH